MLRHRMEHIRDRPPRRDRIDRDTLMPAVLREDADKRVDGALGTRVQAVTGDGEVLSRVGGHENDAAGGVEVAVGFAGDEELAARVECEDAVEFFL